MGTRTASRSAHTDLEVHTDLVEARAARRCCGIGDGPLMLGAVGSTVGASAMRSAPKAAGRVAGVCMPGLEAARLLAQYYAAEDTTQRPRAPFRADGVSRAARLASSMTPSAMVAGVDMERRRMWIKQIVQELVDDFRRIRDSTTILPTSR